MVESVRNILMVLLCLVIIPVGCYFGGAWIPGLWESRHFTVTFLGTIFGMRGIFYIFYNDVSLKKISELGGWRVGIIGLAFVIMVTMLVVYHQVLAYEWLRQIVQIWTQGIIMGVIMQMIFNEQVIERRKKQNQFL
jgi:hypothetical protein